MRRRASPHYGSKKRTKAEGEIELINFLCGARPEKIRAASAPELAQRYGTDARETADALKLAQERVQRDADAIECGGCAPPVYL